MSHKLGIALKDLKVPVRRIQSVEHRMKILDKGPVTIIDDAFNSNPAGSKAAVETLAMFDGVRILITPRMVELGAEEERYIFPIHAHYGLDSRDNGNLMLHALSTALCRL